MARQGIQSIEVGARILQALARAPHPQMLRDLAAAAQMPAAKAHRYLVSFARMGLVEQQADTGLYDLGSFALELGLGALARLEHQRIEIITNEEITEVEAAWLVSRLGRDGHLSPSETALVKYLEQEGPKIHPSLSEAVARLVHAA